MGQVQTGRSESPPLGLALGTLVPVLVLAVNLRLALAGVGPLLPEIRTDLQISRSTAGLLTSLPVLCFAALSTVATLTGRRLGLEWTVVLAMVVLTLGIVVRSLPAAMWIVLGTVLIGAGIATANVLLPSVIKRDFPEAPGRVTGLYTAVATAGAAAAAAVSAPLSGLPGMGWQGSLLVTGLASLAAAAVWVLRLRDRHQLPSTPPGSTRIWRSRVTWYLAIFLGLHAWIFYAVFAWLPAILQDQGVSATSSGWALALFNVLGIATSLAVPALADRRPDQRLLALTMCVGWAVALLGLAVLPSLYLVWASVAGLSNGAGLSLALTMVLMRARTPTAARDLSGGVQSLGYLLGASGPFAIGWVRDHSEGWTGPLLVLTFAVLVMAVAGNGAARDRTVG